MFYLAEQQVALSKYKADLEQWEKLQTRMVRTHIMYHQHTYHVSPAGAVILHGHDNWKITENFTLDSNKLHGKITENV